VGVLYYSSQSVDALCTPVSSSIVIVAITGRNLLLVGAAFSITVELLYRGVRVSMRKTLSIIKIITERHRQILSCPPAYIILGATPFRHDDRTWN
jgi:hypothetical protein